MSKGFLFELFVKAEAERADQYIHARCGNDPSLAGLLDAEYIQREADQLARKLRSDGKTKDAKRAGRLFRNATKRCRALLSEWRPSAQQQRPN